MTGNLAGFQVLTLRALLADIDRPADAELADLERTVRVALLAAGHDPQVSREHAAKLRAAIAAFGSTAETLRAQATTLLAVRQDLRSLLHPEEESENE